MPVDKNARQSAADISEIRRSKKAEAPKSGEAPRVDGKVSHEEVDHDPRSWMSEETQLAGAVVDSNATALGATVIKGTPSEQNPSSPRAARRLKLGGTQRLGALPQKEPSSSSGAQALQKTALGGPKTPVIGQESMIGRTQGQSVKPKALGQTQVQGSITQSRDTMGARASASPPPQPLSKVPSRAPNAPTYQPSEHPTPQSASQLANLGSAATSAMIDEQAEAYIGQYEIIRKLGEGGMGVVYLARDSRLGRRVAIKVLRTQDKELTRRFIIEARTTARCTHENIVIIHDAGEHNKSPFMVLEFLEGKALSDYLESDPPTIPHAVEIMVSVVRALVRAHEQGIVHRDLKPDNIFVTDSGTVKVLDFGIAKLLKKDMSAVQSLRLPSQGARGAMLQSMSGAGTLGATGIAGTACYMSPEQWHTPGDVDHRSDIWAVGCTLFELITGQNPLEHHETPTRVAQYLLSEEVMPTALSYGAKIPEQLSEIIARCLAKKREERFKDARSLLKALEPFLPGRRQALDGPVELGPFAGLRAFQEEDAARFFGRSRELGTLLSRLRETPLMATVGPSGVGKSSFLRAGVIPALKNSGVDWEVLVVRPGRTPLQSLAEHIRPYVQEFTLRQGGSVPPSGSDEQIAQRLTKEPGFLGAVLRDRCREKGQRIMLFLDQFEELYTLGASADERRAFTRALLGAADDAASPLRVMLSIRADFLGRTTEDPEFVATLSKGLFFLGPPSEEGLREALVRPAEMMGYRFETNAIVDEMIEFLDGTPNGLPLLQFTAAQLWDARDPQRKLLTLSSYRGMGGVEGALVSHADSVYNQLLPELQVLCRTLFMHLVTNERTRAIRSMQELRELAEDSEALKSLVDQLVDSRLWVVTVQDGDPTVEVVHESLITSWPSLRRWLDESHEDSVFIDQLMAAAHQWSQKHRDVGLLWRGEMVAELEHFLRHYKGNLPEIAAEFAEGVRRQDLKSVRLKRTLTWGGVTVLTTLLLAALGGLFIVNEERNKASDNAQIAEERLAEQIRADKERVLAEAERSRALAKQKQAEEKTDILEDTVKLNAEELAQKNIALEDALSVAQEQEATAIKSKKRAEKSEKFAKEAKKRAEETSKELKSLLDKERARAERLDAQIGTLVEDL